MKKMICLVLCLLSVAMLSGCGGSGNTSLRNGQEITLSGSILMASSKSGVDEIIDYVRENNNSGLSRMQFSGEARKLGAGTKVTIVKVGTITEVKTSDNKHWFTVIEMFE